MRRLAIGLVAVLLATSIVQSANALTVGFMGVLNEKTLQAFDNSGVFGGVLGPLTPPVQYSVFVDITPRNAPDTHIGDIASGAIFWNDRGKSITTVAGGTVKLTNFGNTMEVDIKLGGDMDGNLVFTLGTSGNNSTVLSAKTLSKYINVSSTTNAFLTDGSMVNGFAQYKGTAAAVPEPSGLAALGLIGGVIALRRRRRT